MRRALYHIIDRFLLLPIGAVLALCWANSEPESYFRFSHASAFLVNDVAMAFFFALVAKEVVEASAIGGVLHTWRRISMGVAAGVGGVLGAYLVYNLYLLTGDELSVLYSGWPVTCATDLAFSYFIARAVCKRAAIPFLLLIGITSNIIGIVALAGNPRFSDRNAVALVTVLLAMWCAYTLRRRGVRSAWPYMFGCGGLSWAGLYWAGIEPSLALIPIVPFLAHASHDRGFLVPAEAGARDTLSQLDRLVQWPAHVALFFFGLVNAGAPVRGFGTGTWAVVVGTFAGKPAGVLLTLIACAALGLLPPKTLRWRDMVVVAFATSIGFSFSLLFTTMAFPVGSVLTEVKIGALLTIVPAMTTILVARALKAGRFAGSGHRPGRGDRASDAAVHGGAAV